MRTILNLLSALALFPFLADEPQPARKQTTSTQTAPATEPAKQQDKAIQAIQQLLDEPLVEGRLFQKELPLAEFLAALEKHLPREMKLSLRIDKTPSAKRPTRSPQHRCAYPHLPQRRACARSWD